MDFRDAYDRLNDEQKQAVDTIYGPVAVIAGPGSGKTQLLSLRIAKILQEADVTPESILCLTFTHSACETMRRRLLRLVWPVAYRVEIHTFHSFGALLLARIKGIKIDPELTSDSEALVEWQVASRVRVAELLDHLIEALPFDHVLFRTLGGKDDRRSLIATLQGLFSDLKNEQITPARLHSIALILEEGMWVFEDFLGRYARALEAIGALRSQAAKDQAQLVWGEMLGELPRLLSSFDTWTASPWDLIPSQIWVGIFRDILGDIYQDTLDGEDVSMSELKKKIIDFASLSTTIKSPLALMIERVRWVADLFVQYDSAMQERGYYDFQDLLSHAYAHITEHQSVASELAERYQFILIDEFQDTNELQLQLATSFLHGIEDPNILVVWDDDQAIYKFQGATIKNFQHFLHRYPQAQVVILKQNYRSTPEIIAFSRSIMEGASESVTSFLSLPAKEFVAARVPDQWCDVELRSYAQSVDEMAMIVEEIKQYRHGGGQWSDVAILARSNTTIRRYALALMQHDIPCVLSSDEYFESDEMITQFVALSCIVGSLAGYATHLDPIEAFGRVITAGMYGEDRSRVWSTYIRLRDAQTPLSEMIAQMSLDTDLGVYKELMRFVTDVSMLVDQESIERILDLLTGERSLSECLLASTEPDNDGQLSFGVNSVERRSPFYEACILQYTRRAPSLANARLHSFELFMGEVRNFLRDTKEADFSTYMHYLRLGGTYGFPSKLSPLFLADQDAVILSTIHKAKGAEYPRVFVVATTHEEYAPKNRATLIPKSILPPKALQDIDDERRLIYTACTRAQDALVVSRSSLSLSLRSSHPPESLSRCDWQDMPPASPLVRQQMLWVLHMSPDRIFWAPSQDELVFLRSRAALLSMNATLLSSFFEIAESGVEGFIRRSLLRLPSSSSILQIQGTAFHQWLEWWVSAHTRTGVYDDTLFFQGVDAQLGRARLLETEKDQIRTKISSLFPLIREDIIGSQRDETFVEYPFGLAPGQEKVYLDDIPLTGKIDRIDTHKNGVLELYDYKTSRLHTPKLSYELQLSFYSVLMSLSRRFASFESRSYHLQALEPSKDGSLTRRSYYPSHTEIERDKKLIAYVYKRILACDFDVPDTVHTAREWYEYILGELGYAQA